MFLWPYHCDLCLTLSQQWSSESGDKTCYHVILTVEVFRTKKPMSSRRSVQNHWHFEHYLQGLCHVLVDTVRNHTKIGSWSFPISLFLWCTVWCSLLILMIRVFDIRDGSWKSDPSPVLCHSLKHAHVSLLTTPTFITITCTQVLWFLSRLVKACSLLLCDH